MIESEPGDSFRILGDMLSNHVTEHVPAKGAVNVPMSSTIVVKLDSTVTVKNSDKSMVVKCGDVVLEGVCMFA